MGFKSLFSKGIGGGLNVKRWVGYGQIKSDTKVLGKLFQTVFSRRKEKLSTETFEEAVVRHGLTEEDIKKKMQSSRHLVIAFLSFALLLFLYSLYQWGSGAFLNGMICFLLALLSSAYAFREHFNLYQMKQRRLGCTYSEWFKSLLSKGQGK